jgi:hypothetical protein
MVTGMGLMDLVSIPSFGGDDEEGEGEEGMNFNMNMNKIGIEDIINS